jgi:phosphate transport system substrate-binding protein
MFKLAAVAAAAAAALSCAVLPSSALAANISGAGATFPAPVYAKWAEVYRGKTGVGLNYQAIGSGGGIKQIQARTVAFGATDKPLKSPELTKAGLLQFPTVLGGVTPIVNLPGVAPGKLKLNGPLLADIYLGNVKRWNDPRIAALNPGVRLLPMPITVVHRSDGSGTSFQFTSYLAMKSPAWARKVGANDAVAWPIGLGGKGNDGVSAFVKQTIGAIGYVEYAYAKQNKAAFVLVQNKAGQYPQPVAANFTAAAAGADWAHAPGNYMLLLDEPGPTSWPITAATFVLVQKKQSDAASGAEVLKFFDWAYRNGDGAAAALDYVPMPAPVKAMVRKQWAGVVGPNGKPVYLAK